MLILIISTGLKTSAQKITAADSVMVALEKPEHSPRKATIYSAVLPGLGQIYNKKYWKVPLVYIGFGTLGYFIDWNNDQYTLYREAYADIADDDPNTNSFEELNFEGRWNLDNPRERNQFSEALNRAKETARRNRDLVIISTAAFYALNIIDASVDAHLFNFDISDDLTMKWIPGPVYCLDQRLVGIHCRIRF
ncbi:hypothetical protein DET65_1148 [Sunxiuqinia elliptica]|uniref:DUF5683 domain-containing protein n=1 Tax=Sunxiuqinia elliptica TaxID=655355 RepID=A0A4R6H9R2_9BACT|nr:hypothetical protein DET52_101589 [Sunxiuqinia elliptica]TDO64782.1 hypothetical protein DET65_1148 [Sunxiuqinia elliptica]